MKNTKILLAIVFCLITKSLFSQQTKESSRTWTSFFQPIAFETDIKRKFIFSGHVKVLSSSKNAWAALTIVTKNKDGEEGINESMKGNPIQSDKWEKYQIIGYFDEKTEKIILGAFCVFNGKFYFDDFQLLIENDSGEMIPFSLPNSSFEKKISDENLTNWNEGADIDYLLNVKEFTIKSSKETVEGNLSLLIEGAEIDENKYRILSESEEKAQIESLIFMLDNLKKRVERTVKNLSLHETDYLHDEKANRIGALIMHLAAAEKYYQLYTFENREFNDEEKKMWGAGLNLDQAGRNTFKGKPISYYLEIYNKVREETITLLEMKNDAWLKQSHPGTVMNHYYSWFHVMEHQSSHLGQILFLKKRIPPEPKLEIKPKIKG